MVLLFPFFAPQEIIKGTGNIIQKSTSIRKTAGAEATGVFTAPFGKTQIQQSTSFQDLRDFSQRSNVIIGSQFGGGFETTERRIITPQITQTPTQSIEDPLSFAPALIGGGTTTGTGQSDVTGGLDLLPLLAVGGGIVVLLAFLGRKKKKKK